jgi:hypothetical protein
MSRMARTLVAAAVVMLLGAAPLAAQPGPGKGPPPAPPPPGAQGRLLEISGFATAGALFLAAKQSLEAVLGSSSGRIIGGGGQIAVRRGPLRNLFARVDVSRFRETGQRVFVFQGEVFDLGIPTIVTLTPIELTVGYRVAPMPRPRPGQPPPTPPLFVPYGGLGVGSMRYEETSSFAQPGDDLDTRFTSYHALGGVDVHIWRWLGAGVEGVYRWVPDALGDSGVSAAFNETNLNGGTVRLLLRAAW